MAQLQRSFSGFLRMSRPSWGTIFSTKSASASSPHSYHRALSSVLKGVWFRSMTLVSLAYVFPALIVLLARGRTVPYISDELSIAQGTAKHHVSNIYRKVGVFDRQGLLDAIEQGGVGRSALAADRPDRPARA